MAGILESLFDDGGWQQVLGIAPKPPAPTPQPPPFALNQAGPTFSPTSTFDSGGQLSFNDRAAPVQTAIQEGVFDPQGSNGTDFKPMPVGMTQRDVPLGLPGVSPPQPYTTYPDQNQPSPAATAVMPTANGGALPPPAPTPQEPRPALTPQEPRPPVTMPLPSGADAAMPLKVSAPPMPPPMRGDVPTSGGGGLMAALGLATPEARQAALAGVGRGLSAVGQMRSGAPRGAAIATGLGGAIQGQQAKAVEQQQTERQAKTDLFNQSSTAFKDMLAADAAGDNSAYKAAQAKYLAARATAMTTGIGSPAWQNTPYGKVIQVESKTQAYEKAQQIVLQKQWTLNGASVDQQKDDLANLKKQVDDYRSRLYKAIGVSQADAENIKKLGTSEDNPFDARNMSSEHFNATVPMGAYYKDQNGAVKIRIKPPAGMAPMPDSGSTMVDDQAALTQ